MLNLSNDQLIRCTWLAAKCAQSFETCVVTKQWVKIIRRVNHEKSWSNAGQAFCRALGALSGMWTMWIGDQHSLQTIYQQLCFHSVSSYSLQEISNHPTGHWLVFQPASNSSSWLASQNNHRSRHIHQSYMTIWALTVNNTDHHHGTC